jgi:septal ring-binding cell division protein DamX
MQDLGHYKKKEYIEIHSRYASLILAGSVVLVGLVFAMGLLVGSRRSVSGPGICEQEDPLAALDRKSKEPPPPQLGQGKLESYHDTLGVRLETVPTPASIMSASLDSGEAAITQEAELAQVQIQEPRGEEEPVPEDVAEMDPGVYSLQVASFQDQREASLLVKKLQQAGHKAFLVSVHMADRGGDWYRVRVGPFSNKKNAWAYKKTFEERERLPAFVVKKRARNT